MVNHFSSQGSGPRGFGNLLTFGGLLGQTHRTCQGYDGLAIGSLQLQQCRIRPDVPRCRKCQTTMMLARITLGPSGFDIRTFECPACDLGHQLVVELTDPMKSLETAGWFQGLQAPT